MRLNLKSALLCALLLVSASAVHAQRGLSFGPSGTFGQVFSRNLILSDTSDYYVKNSPGMFVSGGLDVLMGVTDRVTLHAGIAYNMKQFKLKPQDNETGASYPELAFTRNYLSIPMAVHYRMPLGQSQKTWINFMAGHTLDLIKKDSSVIADPSGVVVDSGGSYSARLIQLDKKTMPTVLLGVGLNFVNARNSALDISLVWGIGTGKMVRGDIKEWTFLDKQFNPGQDPEPQEFPDSYFDYAMRGSYISLRVSYWFNTGILSVKKEKPEPTPEKPLPPLRDPSKPEDQ